MQERGSRLGLTVFLAVLFGFLAGGAGSYVATRLQPAAPAGVAVAPRPAPAPTGALPAADAGSVQTAFVAAVKRAEPAVVNIDTFAQRISPEMRRQAEMMRQLYGMRIPDEGEPVLRGSGSGFVFDAKQGYVLTNQHVVAGATRVAVTLADDRELEAEVVGADPLSDVAVLRIPAENLPEVPLALDAPLEPGMWAIAIGNPFREFRHTVSVGVISALNRTLPIQDRSYSNLIQTDAAINVGNSGGPLCNINGEVIGINSAIFSPTETSLGIGFAIPIGDAMAIARNLIQFGSVPYLGVAMGEATEEQLAALDKPNTPLPPADKDDQKLVVVASVSDGGPAQQAGVQPGDVLLTVADQKVTVPADVQAVILRSGVGEKLPLKVRRNGKELAVTVTLGKRPTEAAAAPQPAAPQPRPGR